MHVPESEMQGKQSEMCLEYTFILRHETHHHLSILEIKFTNTTEQMISTGVNSEICWQLLTRSLSVSVVFPQDLLEKGLEASNFAMLGLGDIVIPGIFIALLLRFDVR